MATLTLKKNGSSARRKVVLNPRHALSDRAKEQLERLAQTRGANAADAEQIVRRDAQALDPWVKVRGVLVYAPDRGNFRKQHKVNTLVLELPRDDLDVYYHWLLERRYGSWHKLQRPMFGKHVTVIRGDERHPVEFAHSLVGERVEVEYNPTGLKRNWQFWNLPVRSWRLKQIRTEAGLRAEHDFHITIGRNYEWQPTKY